MGLIPRVYGHEDREHLSEFENMSTMTPWERFHLHIKHLNRNAEQGSLYKVLYLGRHGEGYHNVAERFYGTDEWNVSLLAESKFGSR